MADEQRRCIEYSASCRVSAKFLRHVAITYIIGPQNFVQIAARKSAFVQDNQRMQP